MAGSLVAPTHEFHYVVGILGENDEKSDVIEYFLRGTRKIETQHCARMNGMSPPWVVRLLGRQQMCPSDPILFYRTDHALKEIDIFSRIVDQS